MIKYYVKGKIGMATYNIKEQVQSFGLKKVISYLDFNPDKNILKIIDWAERFNKDIANKLCL